MWVYLYNKKGKGTFYFIRKLKYLELLILKRNFLYRKKVGLDFLLHNWNTTEGFQTYPSGIHIDLNMIQR